MKKSLELNKETIRNFRTAQLDVLQTPQIRHIKGGSAIEIVSEITIGLTIEIIKGIIDTRLTNGLESSIEKSEPHGMNVTPGW